MTIMGRGASRIGSAVWLASLLILCGVGSASAVGPVLERVTPYEIVAGSEGVSIAVQGTGFDVSTVVKWGATALSTTVYGSTAAVASVPDATIASAGMGVITVENNDGGSNSIGVPVVDGISKQLEPVLYIVAGIMGAMAFIWGFGTKW